MESVDILIFLISCLAVGLFEELFFRVFVFHYLLEILAPRKNKLILSIISTSLIFGFAHLTNLFNPEYHKISVINQVLFAASIGFVFQSIYIRTRSLTIITCLHALINFFGSYKNNLLEDVDNIESQFTFNDFMTTFLTILMFTILVVLPLSYLLIRKELSHNNETPHSP